MIKVGVKVIVGVKKMKRTISLKSKLMLILLCITLVPLLCSSVFLIYYFNSTVSDNIKTHEMDLADSSVNVINAWLDENTSQLENILKAHPEFVNMDKD